MKFVFDISLSDEVKQLVGMGSGSYPIASGTLHVQKVDGRTYIAYEKDGRATWHVVVNTLGNPIECIPPP